MSKYHKALGLQGPGFEMTAKQYQDLMTQVQADLAEEKHMNAYFSDKATRMRSKELFADVDAGSIVKNSFEGIQKSALDYYRRIAAAELMSQKMAEIGRTQGDISMRNKAVQTAALAFATASYSHEPGVHYARPMPALTAAFAADEAGRMVANGKNTEMLANMLPGLSSRIPSDYKVSGKQAEWWKSDNDATKALKDHFRAVEKLPAAQASWGVQQGIVGCGGELSSDYLATAVSISKTAAIASVLQGRTQSPRDHGAGEKLMVASVRQVKKLAQVASLSDGNGSSAHYDQTMAIFAALENKMRDTDPATAQFFTELSDTYAAEYGEFDPKIAIQAASIDTNASVRRPIADKLYEAAAMRLQSVERNDNIVDVDPDDSRGGAVTGIGGLKPSDDFMKEDRSDDFWRQYDPQPPSLTPDSVKRMSKADLHTAKKSSLTTSEAALIEDWEAIERMLTGKRMPAVALCLSVNELSEIASDDVAREVKHMRELEHEHTLSPPRPSFAPSF